MGNRVMWGAGLYGGGGVKLPKKNFGGEALEGKVGILTFPTMGIEKEGHDRLGIGV